MDVSAQTTMKDAANCDKRCEWQNSANQENAERILHLLDTPKGMSGSGRLYNNVAKTAFKCDCVLVNVYVRQRRLIRWRMNLSSFWLVRPHAGTFVTRHRVVFSQVNATSELFFVHV